MGKLYTEIDERMRQFVAAQHLFFVATAPGGEAGHVNCSPKGREADRAAERQISRRRLAPARRTA